MILKRFINFKENIITHVKQDTISEIMLKELILYLTYQYFVTACHVTQHL